MTPRGRAVVTRGDIVAAFGAARLTRRHLASDGAGPSPRGGEVRGRDSRSSVVDGDGASAASPRLSARDAAEGRRSPSRARACARWKRRPLKSTACKPPRALLASAPRRGNFAAGRVRARKRTTPQRVDARYGSSPPRDRTESTTERKGGPSARGGKACPFGAARAPPWRVACARDLRRCSDRCSQRS